MTQKKEKKIDLEALEPEELMKYEIAGELGLLDRVMEIADRQGDWKGWRHSGQTAQSDPQRG